MAEGIDEGILLLDWVFCQADAPFHGNSAGNISRQMLDILIADIIPDQILFSELFHQNIQYIEVMPVSLCPHIRIAQQVRIIHTQQILAVARQNLIDKF